MVHATGQPPLPAAWPGRPRRLHAVKSPALPRATNHTALSPDDLPWRGPLAPESVASHSCPAARLARGGPGVLPGRVPGPPVAQAWEPSVHEPRP
ncbi:MAG: hypothetical protein LBL95_08395 [Deltaproteobacteria bacterium]|nr:hypothetical protein [Deltaproteobacteria bacterium]